jgi:hypothetical protein
VAVETPATGGGRGLCLEVHDLAISKLAAGREKDLEFVEAMLAHSLTNIEVLRERLRDTERLDQAKRPVIEQWLDAREPRKV